MNERIKELIWETDEWLESNAQSDRWEREIKFAELIVQECILTIQMGITRDGHNTEKYLRSIKHIKQIKETFQS